MVFARSAHVVQYTGVHYYYQVQSCIIRRLTMIFNKIMDDNINNRTDINSDVQPKQPGLTGRLEMRLPEEVELKILKMIDDSNKTKTEVVTKCIMRKTLRYHLTPDEIEAYRTLSDVRNNFKAIKNALKGRSQEERRHLFKNDQFMAQWIAIVDQCIEQWSRIIDKLIDK